MKGLFTISTLDDLDILSVSKKEQMSHESFDLKKTCELTTDEPYTSSSDLELENLISSNNVMI